VLSIVFAVNGNAPGNNFLKVLPLPSLPGFKHVTASESKGNSVLWFAAVCQFRNNEVTSTDQLTIET
jgi:hypothetical protein